MTILTQVGVVLAKIETTPGVDATPSPTTDFITALTASFAPNFQVIERDYLRPSISGTPIVMGRQLATVTFETEVVGTGVAASGSTSTTENAATPKWADLLCGCGFAPTSESTPNPGQVYNPITNNQTTLSIYVYLGGILHKLLGAMGTFNLTAVAGELAKIQWTFTGVYQAPTAVAVPAVTIPTIVPPIVQSAQFAIGTTASTVFVPQQITLDIANTVTPRDDANSARGFNSMIITARKPSFTVNPESVPEASHPFWTDFAAANGKAVSFNVGTVAGNTMGVAITNMQISNLQYTDRSGIRTYEVTGMVSSTSTTGNDEVSFTFL
jgi:hypothetical protein